MKVHYLMLKLCETFSKGSKKIFRLEEDFLFNPTVFHPHFSSTLGFSFYRKRYREEKYEMLFHISFKMSLNQPVKKDENDSVSYRNSLG